MTIIVLPCRDAIELTLPRRLRRTKPRVYHCTRSQGHTGPHRNKGVQWEHTGAIAPQGFIQIKTKLSEADYEQLKARFLGEIRRLSPHRTA